MKPVTLSQEELLNVLDAAEAQKPTRLLSQIGLHLESKRSLQTAAVFGNALRASSWQERPLTPPSEALPPLA